MFCAGIQNTPFACNRASRCKCIGKFTPVFRFQCLLKLHNFLTGEMSGRKNIIPLDPASVFLMELHKDIIVPFGLVVDCHQFIVRFSFYCYIFHRFYSPFFARTEALRYFRYKLCRKIFNTPLRALKSFYHKSEFISSTQTAIDS